MARLLLVEDDNNLREIYAARLEAEGYEVFTAADGEAALTTAIDQKPDLIMLDVMMPKISGFDVLDILRSTPETKHAKIMMMTALSQQSDKERGERLGADRYMVKSQVTLEDVITNVADLLNEESVATQTMADQVAATQVTGDPIDVPLPIENQSPTTQAQDPAPIASGATPPPQAAAPDPSQPDDTANPLDATADDSHDDNTPLNQLSDDGELANPPENS